MSLQAPEAIKKMWSHRAKTIEAGEQVTHRDVYQRNLEVAALAQHLQPTDEVLDIGCGNGWASVQLAPLCRHLTGMDYSPDMIQRARADHGTSDHLSWTVGDVLALADVEKYDVIITVRCLINVVEWQLQCQAIRNIHRALKSGGRFLMMEGLQDGRDGLNRLRQEIGLAAMPPVTHNLDFPAEKTTQFLNTLFASVTLHARGIYDVITRALYPLMIKPAEPTYNSPYHAAAFQLAQKMPGMEELARFGHFYCVK
jgi:ubiquinone/menaquinone biosynthesis C-methylase UbiE